MPLAITFYPAKRDLREGYWRRPRGILLSVLRERKDGDGAGATRRKSRLPLIAIDGPQLIRNGGIGRALREVSKGETRAAPCIVLRLDDALLRDVARIKPPRMSNRRMSSQLLALRSKICATGKGGDLLAARTAPSASEPLCAGRRFDYIPVRKTPALPIARRLFI